MIMVTMGMDSMDTVMRSNIKMQGQLARRPVYAKPL